MGAQNFRDIGTRLYAFRKKTGLSQEELAEKAGVSGRTYADIERGTVNMRVETLLRICGALHVTPNDVLLDNEGMELQEKELFERLNTCSPQYRKTAFAILSAYLQASLKDESKFANLDDGHKE